MKPKLKRTIAREGLIIITLIILASITIFLDIKLGDYKYLYEANVQEITPTIKGPIPDSKYQEIIPQEITLRFPKNTDDIVIEQRIKRDFPNIRFESWITWNIPNNENIKASYDEKGNRVFNSVIYRIDWSYAYIFFLVFAYPLYLLIKFIIWAIGTLIKKDILT